MAIEAAKNCSYPLRRGNYVAPLIDGGPAFRRIAEAALSARQAVWVTVAFHHHDFELPGGRGSLFDFLDTLAKQGKDVRALFWRMADQDPNGRIHFHGLDHQQEFLRENRFSFKARWDVLPNGLCHHQKSWIADPNSDRPIAFVGGINLEGVSVKERGHDHDVAGIHDVYLEVQGPSASDVVHNFIQRWNGASERNEKHGAWPDNDLANDLVHPSTLAGEAGETPVQISRTIRKQQEYHPVAAIGVEAHPIAGGEKSTLETYLNAISGAQSTIYIEDQVLASNQVLAALIEAAERGIEIVALAPIPANDAYRSGREAAPDAEIFKQICQLADYPNFTLAGICKSKGNGVYDDIYVHAKIMLIDDVWTTIGSTNIADRSFHGDTELNASFWCEETTKSLRVDLLAEHLGVDTGEMSDVEALALYKRVAAENAALRSAGSDLPCLAFELDPRTYGIDALTGSGAVSAEIIYPAPNDSGERMFDKQKSDKNRNR
jgi:phosphatidylserine/phosphatidylglycerophosphate/cardiolipin synthase-like enzyme